jgi:hypothetical protein
MRSSFNRDNRNWLLSNIYKNDKPNFHDRDLIVLSGTKPGVGNSGEAVLKTAQEKGLISQELDDFIMDSRDPGNTIEKFYAYSRTEDGVKMAKDFNERFEIIGEWVARPNWEEASTQGCLQVYVNAWYKDENGKYYNPNGKHNHAVMMANYKEKKIFDSYDPCIKELRSWDDAYYWALKINIKEKNMEKPNIANNALVILVEGSGSIGLFLDGKIIVDDVAKLMAVFMARNAKNGNFMGGPVVSLKQADWDKFEKRDLKG